MRLESNTAAEEAPIKTDSSSGDAAENTETIQKRFKGYIQDPL